MNLIYGANPARKFQDYLTVQIQSTVRLMEKVGDTVYLHETSPYLTWIEDLSGFDVEHYFKLTDCSEDGFYFVEHQTRKGDYLGADLIDALVALKARNLALNIQAPTAGKRH